MCRGVQRGGRQENHPLWMGWGTEGAQGAHLPYLVNDMGNPWVKKFDLYPYPYLSKPIPIVQGYRWFSSGVDDV